MKKLIGTLAIIATLGAGAFALSTVLPAGAQSSPSTDSSSAPAPSNGGRCDGPHHILTDALAGLVQDGTLTQEQSDAVVQAVKDTAKAELGDRHRARALAGAVKVAADTIGVTPTDLVQARRNGQSIADVANQHGVDPQAVVDAIVTAGNSKIDSLLNAGTITQDQATKAKDRLPDLANRIVNGTGRPC